MNQTCIPKKVFEKQTLATLLMSCCDQQGIVAKVTGLLAQNECNIVESDQYSSDHNNGFFFMRLLFTVNKKLMNKDYFQEIFQPLANTFNIEWSLFYNNQKIKSYIFVSKETHCLVDLLWRWQSNELDVDFLGVISNHQSAQEITAHYELPFHYFPITNSKKDQELAIQEFLNPQEIDLIILARYMQILSPKFIELYPKKIINIHHSFLPAFAGAKPYEQAYQYGVKIIGATAHFATADLDAGPIIEQDVIPVSHKDRVADFQTKGQYIERAVLSKAVRYFLEHRIIIFGNKTIVF